MSRLQNVRRVRLSVNTLEDRTTPAGFDHVYHVTDGATLAAAVQTADTQTGASEIVLDRMGTYNVPATLPITADITITGRSLYHPASYIIQPASGVQDRVIDLTTNNTLVLQNLTIQGGTTTGNGGGVEVTGTGATLRLVYANVRDNTAAGDGGGIHVADGTLLSIFHGTFSDNTAGAGGGAVYFAAVSQAGTVAVNGAMFSQNTAGGSSQGDGGGMDVVGLAPGPGTPAQVMLTLQRTTFDGNTTSRDGGGVWAQDVGTVNVDRSIFRNNTSGQDAGGLGNSDQNLDAASFTFTHGTVVGNRVTGPGANTTPDGGGVCFDFSGAAATGQVTANILYNRFQTNTVAGAGGGLFVRDQATGTTFNAMVSANVFSGNRTKFSTVASDENGDGAGAYIAASAGTNTVTVNENTFVRNVSVMDGGGLAFRLDSGTASVSGNTILYNTANENGGGVYLTGTPGGTIVMQNDNIQYNSAGAAGGGVFNASDTVRIKGGTIAHNSAPTDPNRSGKFGP